MKSETTYVRVDEHGVYRVGSTRVMLDSIIAAATPRKRSGSNTPRRCRQAELNGAVIFIKG